MSCSTWLLLAVVFCFSIPLVGCEGIVFQKVYLDGLGADSRGFTLLLRPYERHLETMYQPTLVDVRYSLINDGSILYTNRISRIELFGPRSVSGRWKVFLAEGENYSVAVEVFLYVGEAPVFLIAKKAYFIAESDAEITDVFGDEIGGSATLKGESMVPLNASLLFAVKKNGEVIEKIETKTPAITLNVGEKTIEVSWDKRLNPGTYELEVALISAKGDVMNSFDKTFEVKLFSPAEVSTPAKTPDFLGLVAFFVLIILALILKRR